MRSATTSLSIVTNVSLADDLRLRQVIPHWLRVFDTRFTELVIVFDPTPPTGRIATLHEGRYDSESVSRALNEVAGLDPRVRVVDLPPQHTLSWLTARWFRSGHPIRCQAGTPILAFLFAIAEARESVVLKADCDMLFSNRGWLEDALASVQCGAADLVQPPVPGSDDPPVSTRALVLSPPLLEARRLPMRAYRLDPLRSLHRRVKGRPSWLALETMLQREVKAGRMSHRTASGRGFALHVAKRTDMEQVAARHLVTRVERCDLPEHQRAHSDFVPAAW